MFAASAPNVKKLFRENVFRLGDKWARLSEGGEKGDCGWLKDKFGLSWQINPPILVEMLSDEDPEKSKRAMEAMMTMTKIDIAALKRAYAGE